MSSGTHCDLEVSLGNLSCSGATLQSPPGKDFASGNEWHLHAFCHLLRKNCCQAVFHGHAHIAHEGIKTAKRSLLMYIQILLERTNCSSYSCLYHTINILLNRGLLKLSRNTKLANTASEHNPLIQCISSATSIVALYDLYTRTFGTGHVVLSLAYSVYTAASIFLLEVQAIGHAAPTTLERLSICLDALQRLQSTNPGKHAATGELS